MIALNADQRRAVAPGEPVRVVDPLTQDAYVVVRAEDFDCLLGISPRPEDHSPNPEIPPGVLRSTPIGDPSPCSRAPGAGTSSVSYVKFDACLVR